MHVHPVSGTERWIAGGGRDAAPGAELSLFCFAHAGGGAAFFRPWKAVLGPDVGVHPVLLPGRESRLRELPYRRIEQLIDPLCAALEPHLDRPYAFFGHSLGSLLAYEVARRFDPVCLLVSGRRAAHLPAGRPLFSTLPDEEFLTMVDRLNGTPPEVMDQPELLRMLLPAMRSDFELNEIYQHLPGPRLTCPVAAYMGADDPEVTPAELLRWSELTSATFTLRIFSGDHFYLRDGRRDVLDAVRRDLGSASHAG